MKSKRTVGSVSRDQVWGHLVLEGDVVVCGFEQLMKRLGFKQIYSTPTIKLSDFTRKD